MTGSRRKLGLVVASVSALLGVVVVLDRLLPPPLERLAERSTVVTDRAGELLRPFMTSDGLWRLPVRLEEVSTDYRALLIGIEDKRFWSHPGVDPLALLRASGQLVVRGHVVSGGSTLTMQLARLLEPAPRTFGAKLRQIARALQLERRLDKRTILEAYLTLVPMGGNLEGVRAGSLAWFGKEPSLLAPAEAALLVALPQSPSRLRPDQAQVAGLTARNRILARAGTLGLLADADIEAARIAPLPTGRKPMPFVAPHLAEQLARTTTSGTVIATTIDGELQRSVEAALRTTLESLPRPINVAAIVLDHRSGAVRALAGSGDYGDTARAGMVDLTSAIRSPGSTLKPFLYGLAFEALLAHPQSIVADRPTRFDDYAPDNFDRGFDGDVTVRQALQRSLNLPAVALLERLGPMAFIGRLAAAGIALELGSANAAPGLPVILGGVGIDLRRLVRAYGGLAHDGEVMELRYLREAPPAPALAMMAREPALAVTDILAGLPRPRGFAAEGRKVAYKTGTSYRYRDGWAVGFDGGHSVGVWIGRPDGASCRPCNGPAGAAPLLFRLFDLLPEVPLPALPAASALHGAPPAGLARLEPATDPPALDGSHGPKISFPVEGATLLVDGGAGELQLRVEGGERPYRWLVDEAPLGERQWRKSLSWAPGTDGFRSLRVIDARGRSDEVAVRVRFRRDRG